MSGVKKQPGLAAEKQALDLYLDSLYDDEGMGEEHSTTPVVSLVPETKKNALELSNTEPERPVVGELQPRLPEQETVSSGAEESSPQQERIRILLFHLSGLKMAIPMAELDGIVDWPEQLVSVPDSMPLYIGLLQEKGRKIPVIDLARLIVPARLRAQQKSSSFERILLIGNRRWGLACNGVAEVVSVESSAVNWRKERSSRKWLAGTISCHGSALLDTVALERLLRRGDELAGA